VVFFLVSKVSFSTLDFVCFIPLCYYIMYVLPCALFFFFVCWEGYIKIWGLWDYKKFGLIAVFRGGLGKRLLVLILAPFLYCLFYCVSVRKNDL